MIIGNKDENGNIYYTFKDILKIHTLTEIFRYGFYVALAIWMCGVCFSTFYNGSVVIRIAVIVILFSFYIFFAVGKAVVESKFGK